MLQIIKNTRVLLKETYDQLWEVNVGLHGAAIAFYAIFSTAPLIIILVWILSTVLGDQLGQAEFRQSLEAIFGTELTVSIREVLTSTASGTTGFWSSLVAIGALLFGATTLLSQFKQTLNMIWGLKDPKINSVWYFLWDRFVGLLFVGALSLLFLAGLISESLLYGLEEFLTPFIGNNLNIIQIGSSFTNVFLAFIFFASMFKILPDLEARWRDIAVGAFVTTLLVILGKSLVDWYLLSAALQPTYKAAGSFVIFLIWIYYNVQVVLLGAIFTKAYTVRHGGSIKPYWDATLEG